MLRRKYASYAEAIQYILKCVFSFFDFFGEWQPVCNTDEITRY